MFIPEKSSPEEGLWLFAYEISLENLGERTVQLHRRFWKITNGDGEVQEVEGAGVVGKTPVLEPGDSFSYVSACPLSTEFGTMEGHYTMSDTDSGDRFQIEVPVFSLCPPMLLQ